MNFHWPNTPTYTAHKYHKLLKQHRYMFVEGLLQVVRFNVSSFQEMNLKEYNVQLFLQQA